MDCLYGRSYFVTVLRMLGPVTLCIPLCKRPLLT